MNPRIQAINQACVKADSSINIEGSMIRDITPDDIIAAFQNTLGLSLEDATAVVESHWDPELPDLISQPDEYIEFFYKSLK